jgi:hypothetical protein
MKRIKLLALLFFIAFPWLLTQAQDARFSIGGEIAYNLSPVKLWDDGYGYWTVDGWGGNFTPALTVRYGDRLAGLFRAQYIRYIFNAEEHSQYGFSNGTYYKTEVHQVYGDFLLEYSFKGKIGTYVHGGPSLGIPVKMNMYTDSYYKDYQGIMHENHYSETLEPQYFGDLQFVVGYGASIPFDDHNILRIETNFRIGLVELWVEDHTYHERVRTICLQFILGYMRNFDK